MTLGGQNERDHHAADWSLPASWFADAAAKEERGDRVAAEISERIAMGGVEGSYEALRIEGERPGEDAEGDLAGGR